MAGAPPRHWGWYRLHASWAERVVADACVRPGDLVLDIGAGDGALIAPLLTAGARVIAFELHPTRAATLHRRYGHDIKVVRADARDLRLPRRPFRVVANPPWALADPLVRRLTAPGSRLVRADLVLKRPTVRRWVEPRTGRGASTHGFALSSGPNVPRRAFHPSPPIDARVLRIDRRPPGVPSGRWMR